MTMKSIFGAGLLAGTAMCLATTAFAADLPMVPSMTTPTMATDWDGFYIGGQVGYGTGFADHTSLVPGNDITVQGWLAGAKAGYNMHLGDQLIGGVEGDFNLANITGSIPNNNTTTETIQWLGSFRGRLGYDAGQFMPYVTAGLAFAHAYRTSGIGGPNNHASVDHIGWTAGAGVEFKATDNMSIDLEARYSDLGSQVYVWSGTGTDPTIHLTTTTVTAGLNWHF
jgi:outer membrane autotransporter protein